MSNSFYRALATCALLLVSMSAFADRIEPEEVLNEEELQVLESPTQDFDRYEEVRDRYLKKSSYPEWSVGFTTTPRAFKKADLRVGGVLFGEAMPPLYGLLIDTDWVFFRKFGFLSVGAAGGAYGTAPSEQKNFHGLLPAMWSLGPYGMYQLIFLHRQWVVPYGRFHAEEIYYKFTYGTKDVKGFRTLFRIDAGLMVYLNFLEPSAAGNLEEGYGVKRTYLSVSYSFARELSSPDFELGDETFRLGLRFEI